MARKNRISQRDYWLKRIKKDSASLNFIPKKLISVEFYIAAVKQNNCVLKYVPDSLKTEAMCLIAVQNNGFTLEYIPEKLRTEVICLSAVKKNGLAIEYVPNLLRTEALCFAAVKEDGEALQYVPESHKTKAMCLAAANETVKALKYVPENLQVQLIPTFSTRLTDDEIEIINVWVRNEYHLSRTRKIDNTIIRNGKYLLIDSSSQSKLINICCVADSYDSISRIEFTENNAKAVLHWAVGDGEYGLLSGQGFATFFSKETNIWKIKESIVEWIS